MTAVDFKRINLGHILTIIIMLAGFVIFYGKLEGRLSSIETNIQWVVKLMDKHLSMTEIAQNKEQHK